MTKLTTAGKGETAPSRWVPLGRSDGQSDHFQLPRKLVLAAVRITDTGGRIHTLAGKPSRTPGVSIRGVGILPG